MVSPWSQRVLLAAGWRLVSELRVVSALPILCWEILRGCKVPLLATFRMSLFARHSLFVDKVSCAGLL